jgi:hypothetical protein
MSSTLLLLLLASGIDASFLRQRQYGVNIEGPTRFANAHPDVWRNITSAFSTVRFDATWERVECCQAGVYNFSIYDQLVRRCAENSVTPYIILDYDNTLYGRCAAGNCLCRPRAVSAFINYSLAVMQRYRSAVFELWNEPNGRNPRPHNMPAASYAALLTTLGRAVRGSPALAGTTLVVGATAGVDASYIAQLGDALQFADAVSVHPYTGSCGGPEIYHDKSTWQHRLFTQLRQTLAPRGLPIISSEVGWSTCHHNASPALCGSYPGSEDTLHDQAIYLARQWLLSCLDGLPATFAYQWADGDGNPANNSDVHPATHNGSDGGDNFGINFGPSGPPKPALLAATYFQTAVGRRDLLASIPPSNPGPNQTDFTFILAFGKNRPPGSFAARSQQKNAAPPQAYGIWSLRMEGSEAKLVGSGNVSMCPGELLQPNISSISVSQGTPATSACEEACRAAPRCRSFVVRPGANRCTLYGSRCLVPALDTAHCGGQSCVGVKAYTLRQTAVQTVSFMQPPGGPSCFIVTDVFGTPNGTQCVNVSTGMLRVNATEAPMYLIAA